ncbi:flagellar hook assembly protein FlgD [Dongia sp.]|uniref:flagellar hook assembly protein FlgD n=1 Tax=Dongia sp. TaxID=1977262 RepID=UPI003753798F
MTTTTAAASGTSAYDIISKQAKSSGTDSTAKTGDDALASLSGDYTNFLTLLTAQLKNQDPLSPMDATQFTQQLVQFSAVEQQINGNKKLDQLIGLQSTANAYGAVGFVGTTIAADSGDVALQDGKAKFDYTVEKAGSATLKILNAAGNVVMLKQVDAQVGTHPVEWDGTDYFGNQLPDGKYTVAVSVTDPATGKATDAAITSYGKVDQAVIADGKVFLKMGDVSVPLEDVIRISKPTETTDETDTGDETDETTGT